VRADGDSGLVASHVRQVVTDVAEDLPILNVRTLEEQIDRTLRQDKLVSNLTSFFGLLALLLACLGLYGVMAYAVSQRTHEIGIRVALGARRAQVLWMVLRDSITLVGIGIIVGIPAAMAAARVASSLFFGLGSMDYVTLVVATAILFLVAVLAGFLPARRASRLHPGTALRYE
jgi:ABC-type antimicrobial peptide transport system permease subunit